MIDNNKHSFSPHPSPLIKFGQLNVNGLCSPVRQQHLLNFFLHSSFGALSINDTRLSPSNAKFIFKNEHSLHHFKSYWACSSSSSRPHDGVGILLRNPLHKHVQTIDPWNGRLLKLDLFFHQTKISIISIYYPPSGSVHQSICNDLIAKLLSWLDYARANNYFVVILGDFNADVIAHSNYSPNHFKLLRLLSSRFFTDHQAHSSTNGPDPTFFHDNGSLRLDYIWSSPGFPAPGLFSQVVTCPGLLDRPFTDHKVLTTVFDFSSCLAILAKSRLKQKKELRTIFSYASTSVEQWNNFTTEVDDSLGVYLDRQYHPNFDFSSLSLDRMWHALKAAIISAAIKTLPFQKFLDRFLYRLTTRRSNRPTQIAQMTAALPSHLENLASLLPDYSVPTYSTTPASVFKSFLRSQKNLVSAFLFTKFAQHLTDSVEYYTALRDEHFSNSLGTFIDSALSVEKRSIVLDRVLVVLDSTPTLLTDPSDIKHAAVSHFQSIVSPPLTRYSSIISFPARWQQAYTSLANVSASLYDPVLAPISLQEWSTVISSMPNNKASGPSKISYEMIKHLSGEALDFSLLLANTCLSRGDIPADWREAVVYPIPKPHEFDAQLKNTRPITLLETVRKCVVKVITNRLSNILADNKVLQGGNFAGLPGGSTDVPIKMLDAIIHQHKHDSTDDQELWIVSQDISKAFDSMDLNILKFALDRLHIPALLVRFILNLFTRRNNKIITCHGDTAAYRVRVGIDQGEIISPLLWVIYLDPLLTVLNQEARDPFILKSSALLNYSPLEFEQHSLPISHLTFMDDSTLIASSKSGIEDRLSITTEFYTLNNVQANSAKYVLLSSSSPSLKIIFDLTPSLLVSDLSLSLSSLSLHASFRFLGIWFSLSASSDFVLKQARSMVKDMAALLGPKKLLAQHVAYLYNAVLLSRLEFRLQTTLFSESTIQSIVKPLFSVLRRKAGLATTTPLPLLFLKLPFSIQNAFYRFLSFHIASWQKIFTHPDFKDFALYAISYLQGYLGAESCPTIINLEPWSQIVSLRTHTLFNSLLFSSRLNIMWSLSFWPPRHDLQPALPLRSILPHSIFQSSWKLWKHLNIFVLAQLVSPCGRYLMNWPDLRYLGIVGRKGRIPNWFTFINNNFLSSSSSTLLLSSYFINSSFTLASSCLLDHTVKDYSFYPQ
ncbi:RNA-directed DNA polymerase from mobile element jockey-like [Rhizophagus irregularis DAOM 181602=DAOM 197198]|nr:RNA-directed DNA polymerase from mobile element jockey-like [Rhizophagus irregularis DAOM 181602=DAOM 197198]